MAKKKTTFFRTTISLPIALKKPMEAARDQVNWSALAASAFTAKLAEIHQKGRLEEMNDIITRLRISKAKGDNDSSREGQEAGESWARRKAEASELENLDDFFQSPGADSFFDDDDEGNAALRLAQVITGGDMALAESRDFWVDALDDTAKLHDTSFLRGFCDGALAIWDKVKDEL